MAKLIIPFIPHHRREVAKEVRLDKCINAAWKFAHCALWPEQQINSDEEEMVVAYITEYFTAAVDKKRAFKALIQRIILTRTYIQSGQTRFVPSPAVWFNRRYPFGFAGTLAWLQKVEQQRTEVPGYLAHLEAFAQQYYLYAIKPTDLHICKCREVILEYHADNLLQLFYNTIVHTHFLRA